MRSFVVLSFVVSLLAFVLILWWLFAGHSSLLMNANLSQETDLREDERLARAADHDEANRVLNEMLARSSSVNSELEQL